MHCSYPDMLSFIKNAKVSWSWQRYSACPLKMNQDSSGSIFIKETIALGLTFLVQEAIITQRSRHIRNTPATCHHCCDATEVPIYL